MMLPPCRAIAAVRAVESAERLSRVLLRASERARGVWDREPSVEPSAQIDQHLELSAPEGGFGRNAVRRLLVLSGQSSYLPAVPMAMLMKAPAKQAA